MVEDKNQIFFNQSDLMLQNLLKKVQVANIFEVVSWDKDKQEGDIKQLFFDLFSKEQKILKKVKNISTFIFDLSAGDKVVAIRFSCDLKKSLENEILENSNFESYENYGIISVVNKIKVEISSEKITVADKLIISQDKIELEGDLEIKGNIKVSSGDVEIDSLGLKNHVHSAETGVPPLTTAQGPVTGKTGKAEAGIA